MLRPGCTRGPDAMARRQGRRPLGGVSRTWGGGDGMLDYNMEEREGQSLYEFLYRSIRRDIEDGVLRAHGRLPSKRLLAQHLGISVITAENAYAQLVAEGYCYSRQRRGYFVSPIPLRTPRAPKAAEPESSRSLPDAVRYDLASAKADPAQVSRVWGKALRRVLASEPDEELYGPQPPKGALRLRRAIADRLRQVRGIDASPERIVIGAGSQMLDAMLAQLIRPSGGIALEDPGYPRLAQIYGSLGLRVAPVPLDDGGIVVEELRRTGAQVAHVMPSHQFPTGIVTSISRRYELLAWASERPGRLIVEDDYDAAFRMAGRPVASLTSIDVQGRVVYTDTFSKSLGPTLRMAFMVLPGPLAEEWDDKVGFYANSVSVIDQVALASLIESGEYDRYVNRYRKAQRDVRDAFIGELRQALGDRFSVEQADSGLHFVLAIEGIDGGVLKARAAEQGVRLGLISEYSLSEGDAAGSVRQPAAFAIQYGGLSLESAREAARIIAGCASA